MTHRNLLLDPFKYLAGFDGKNKEFNPHNLPLTSSIWPTLVLVSFYLLALRVGPRFMVKRKPFQLKTFLSVYNLFQVAACLYFLVNLFHTGYDFSFMWSCHLPGFGNIAHVKLLYFAYIMKIVELSETICFVLRKKQRQMSFLHVYHHVSTAIFSYIAVTRVGNGAVMSLYMLNMIVHTIMYSYYFFSIHLKNVDKIIIVKKGITIMQMVQFTIILVICSRVTYIECGSIRKYFFTFVPNLLLIFYEFFKFYQTAYSKSGRKNAQKSKKLA